MKTIVYSLYDRAVAVYGRPVFAPAWGALARDLRSVINGNGQDMITQHPADFDVYELGSFEDSSGDFQIYARPLLVCNCGAMLVSDGDRTVLDTEAEGRSAKPV